MVSDFNIYKMVESRHVMEKYNEIICIISQFTLHKMNMDECMVVSSVIDKLLPSRKVFKYNLKHQKEEFSTIQLRSHIKIKESLCIQEYDKNKVKPNVEQPVVHMVEVYKNNQITIGRESNASMIAITNQIINLRIWFVGDVK